MNIETGLRGEARMEVGTTDTALALGSGCVEVLGTPRVVALCEEATCNALASRMDEGATTVGMRVQLDHLRPTAIGGEVIAEAILEKIEGRRLTFTVSASDAKGLVAAGKVTRVLVDIERFLAKAD